MLVLADTNIIYLQLLARYNASLGYRSLPLTDVVPPITGVAMTVRRERARQDLHQILVVKLEILRL